MVWHIKLSRKQCFKENYLNFQQVADKAYRSLLLYLLIEPISNPGIVVA